jgi:NADH dehydrogenase FAD-containing subunit
MNVQLVNSLIEVVLNLSPEDQKLFQEKLSNRQIEATTHKSLTSTEKAEQFRQWVAQFPKSNVVESILPNEQQPKTFLQTAKSLQLQGEPDWSEKIDQYLYGQTVSSND